jgi:toxin FitB
MRRATEIWGDARSRGITTAPEEALDGDVILAAHAFVEQAKGNQIEIATTNSSDLINLFPNVLNWDDLKA